MTNYRFRLTFIEPVLGGSPADPEIYSSYIGSNAPDAASLTEEIEALGTDAVEEKGMTVFGRNKDGTPILWNYQIEGFFKDACSMLKRVPKTESSKMKAYKKIIDGLIFVQPRRIPIQLSGDIGNCQRPLRAQTMQGDRVALASSEEAPAGSSIEFCVQCLDDGYIDTVKEWLDYGELRGIGQWRNSGKGRFLWDELDQEGRVIDGNHERIS